MPPRSRGPAPPGRRGTTLRIVRIALLAGVIAFGAVAWFLRSRPDAALPPAGALEVLRIATLVVLVAAAGGLIYLQQRHARERDPARRATLSIVAWALGEAPALFGGVIWLVTGIPTLYVVGVGMLLASFILVPIRE